MRVPTPTLSQLQRALAISEQIESLQAQLAAVLGGSSPVLKISGSANSKTDGRKGKRSAATIAKMKAAQQARWAKKKGAAAVAAVETAVQSAVKSTTKLAKKAKRKLSPEGRARIVAALKKRWAAVKK